MAAKWLLSTASAAEFIFAWFWPGIGHDELTREIRSVAGGLVPRQDDQPVAGLEVEDFRFHRVDHDAGGGGAGTGAAVAEGDFAAVAAGMGDGIEIGGRIERHIILDR